MPLVNLALNFFFELHILLLFGPATVWNQPDEEQFNVVASRDSNYMVLINFILHLWFTKTLFVIIWIHFFHILGQFLILLLLRVTLNKETSVATSRKEHHARRL